MVVVRECQSGSCLPEGSTNDLFVLYQAKVGTLTARGRRRANTAALVAPRTLFQLECSLPRY